MLAEAPEAEHLESCGREGLHQGSDQCHCHDADDSGDDNDDDDDGDDDDGGDDGDGDDGDGGDGGDGVGDDGDGDDKRTHLSLACELC